MKERTCDSWQLMKNWKTIKENTNKVYENVWQIHHPGQLVEARPIIQETSAMI